MKSPTKILLLALVISSLGLAIIDKIFYRYAINHFLPQTKLNKMLEQGDRCIVFLGDSRMAAAIDFERLKNELKLDGVTTCVADLSVGGTTIREASVILRKYLSLGKVPKFLIVGMAADSLLPVTPSYTPLDFSGNGALSLLWSKWDDVYFYFPGFPFKHFDSGFRFLVNRASNFGIFQSLLGEKVQKWQHRLAGISGGPTNQFGQIDVMKNVGLESQEKLLPRLQEYRLSPNKWEEHPSFAEIRKMAKNLRTNILVVELPMVSWFYQVGFKSKIGQDYLEWLSSDLANQNNEFLDLSLKDKISDKDFSDGLHLTAEGAVIFTGALAAAIGDRGQFFE